MAGLKLEFRTFLLELSNDLSPRDVEQFKFAVDVPEGKGETMSEAFKVFHHLLQEDKLSPTNWEILKRLLWTVGRQDLVSRVAEKEEYFAQLSMEENQRQEDNGRLQYTGFINMTGYSLEPMPQGQLLLENTAGSIMPCNLGDDVAHDGPTPTESAVKDGRGGPKSGQPLSADVVHDGPKSSTGMTSDRHEAVSMGTLSSENPYLQLPSSELQGSEVGTMPSEKPSPGSSSSPQGTKDVSLPQEKAVLPYQTPFLPGTGQVQQGHRKQPVGVAKSEPMESTDEDGPVVTTGVVSTLDLSDAPSALGGDNQPPSTKEEPTSPSSKLPTEHNATDMTSTCVSTQGTIYPGTQPPTATPDSYSVPPPYSMTESPQGGGTGGFAPNQQMDPQAMQHLMGILNAQLGSIRPQGHIFSGVGAPIPMFPPQPAPYGWGPSSGTGYHYRPPQRPECYSKNGYEVRIENAMGFKEKTPAAAIVEMRSGTEFKINIRNVNDYDAEVDVDFGGHYLGLWLVEHRREVTIAGSAYEPGNLEFHDKHMALPYSSSDGDPIIAQSSIKCVFTPDATGLLIKRSEVPEEKLILPRRAMIGDIVYEIERKLDKGVKVSGLVKLEGRKIFLKEHHTNIIEDLGFRLNDKLFAVTSEEKLRIAFPDGSEDTLDIDPIKKCKLSLRHDIAKMAGVDEAKRIRLYLNGTRLTDDMKKALVFAYAETPEYPCIKVKVAQELNLKLTGDILTGGEVYEIKTHKYALLKHFSYNLESKGICSNRGKLWHKGKHMKQANYDETMETAGVEDGDEIIIKDLPKDDTRSSTDELKYDGYDFRRIHVENRSLDDFDDLREPEDTWSYGGRTNRFLDDFGSGVSRGFPEDLLGKVMLKGSNFDTLKNFQTEDKDSKQKFEKTLQTTVIVKLITCTDKE